MMKAQFMSLWDGLDTDYNCQVGLGSCLTQGSGLNLGLNPQTGSLMEVYVDEPVGVGSVCKFSGG